MILIKLISPFPLIVSLIANMFAHNVEMSISNTQGSREQVYFDDRKVIDCFAWGPLPAQSTLFAHINTINYRTKVTFTFDKNLSFDLKEFV